MYLTNLRRVGGSVMLAVPPALLDLLDMDANSQARLHIDGGKLIIEPAKNKKYTLESLLAECQPAISDSNDQEWTAGRPCGQELI